jgi:hypothetical protein
MRRPAGTLLLTIPLLAGAVRAQAPGTTGAVLLEIPATARSMALGGASAALLGEAGSVFGNPAGLAPIRSTAVSVSFQRYLVDTWLGSAAVAVRVSKFDLGFGIRILDFGSDSAFVPDPAFGGDRGLATGATIGAYHALGVGTLTYRHGFVSAGVSVKALREHLGVGSDPAVNASAVGADVGVAAAFFDIAALGVVVQNIGSGIRGDSARAPLPHTTRVGFTLNIFDPQGTKRLLNTVEWVSPPGGDAYWIFGFEGGAVSGGVGLLGRLGIVTGRRTTDLRSPVVGGGLVFHNLRIDYAYQGLDALGDGLHRFTLGWVW